MQERIFKATILDKLKEESGWIFKTTNYYVILEVVGLKTKIHKRRLLLEQYYQYKIGDVLDLHLYSADGKLWFFSEEEALDY